MSTQSSPLFSRVLLATDGSPSSQQAAEVAAQIAKSFESEVTVLSAIPSISASVAPMEGEYYSRIIDKADDNADEAAAVFVKAGIAASEKEIPRGGASVVETIVEYAAKSKIDLIVTGTRGLGSFKRAVLGSVSSGVAEHAQCSTLVVRARDGPSAQKGTRRILVGIDDSEDSKRALAGAVALAKGLGAELVIAHVVYVPMLFWSMGVPGSAIPTDKIEKDAAAAGRDLLARAVKAANDQGMAGPRVELVTDLVSPAEGIAQLAEKEDIDIIVVGTRGSGGFAKLLLGSVANSVLHYATCSVLVTR